MQSSRWLRISCVVFALLFITQGYLVMTGSLPQTHYMGDRVFFALALLAVVLTIYILTMSGAKLSKAAAMTRAVGLEIAAIGFIITSTGFGSLLSLSLVLILYEMYLIYRLRGLVAGITLLMVAIIYDIYRSIELGIPNISDIIIVVLTLTAITMTGAAILRIQLVRQEALEKSRAQADLEKYRVSTLMNNLAQGVLSVDSKGIVRMYNAAALNILDTNGVLNGHHVDEVFKVYNERNKRLHFFEHIKNIRQTEVIDDLYYHYHDDTARIEVTVTPIRVGRRHSRLDIDQGFMLLLRDITKQKNLDEERDEFISVVSHELRTPLTIAEGTLSNIEAMYNKGVVTPSRIQPTLKAAHEQIIFLSKMVNDLSTLSRAERGISDETEIIDVDSLLHSLYAEYLLVSQEAGLTLNLDIPHKVGTTRASRLYLSELLHNLISNAIKYTDKGSVTLSAVRKKNTITITVIDTGIGISKTDREQIFDKFYRSEDYRTRETRGTGLGLYVSLKLAAKLGTTITLKSRLNHGSTFGISLKSSDERDL